MFKVGDPDVFAVEYHFDLQKRNCTYSLSVSQFPLHLSLSLSPTFLYLG